MYFTIATVIFILVYLFILISPFIESFRNYIDDEYGDGGYLPTEFYRELNNGYYSVNELILGYFIIHIFLGLFISILYGILWPLLIVLSIIYLILTKVIKSIKNKQTKR
jgi:hypothetical protein